MEIYFPWHRALCWHQKILFFASAMSQHFRIRHKPNSGIRRRIFVAQVFAFAVFATLICQINSVFPCKDTNRYSAVPNSWIVCFWLWHRALCWHQKILFFASATSQHFRIRHKPNSGIRRRIFVAQSFAFAVFATLICQINSVFPCKDTKALFGCVLVNIWKPVEITAA